MVIISQLRAEQNVNTWLLTQWLRLNGLQLQQHYWDYNIKSRRNVEKIVLYYISYLPECTQHDQKRGRGSKSAVTGITVVISLGLPSYLYYFLALFLSVINTFQHNVTQNGMKYTFTFLSCFCSLYITLYIHTRRTLNKCVRYILV